MSQEDDCRGLGRWQEEWQVPEGFLEEVGQKRESQLHQILEDSGLLSPFLCFYHPLKKKANKPIVHPLVNLFAKILSACLLCVRHGAGVWEFSKDYGTPKLPNQRGSRGAGRQ